MGKRRMRKRRGKAGITRQEMREKGGKGEKDRMKRKAGRKKGAIQINKENKTERRKEGK